MTADTPPPAASETTDGPKIEFCPIEACGHKVTKHDQHGCHERLGGPGCGCTIAYKRRNFTDLGNAKRLHDHYGKALRYLGDHTWAAYAATDGVWTFDREAADPWAPELLWRLRTFEALLYSDEHPVDDNGLPLPSERDMFLDYVAGIEEDRKTAAMLRQATRLRRFHTARDAFDSNHHDWLCVANGMLRLPVHGRPVFHREHRPADYATRQTRARWNPDAKCPHFVRILRRQFKDSAEYDYVLALLAKACLIRGNPMKALVLLLGEKDTGKSRIVQALLYAFGSYARPFERSLFTDRNATEKPRSDLMAARGRRFLASTEMDDYRLNADAVKRITGGDSMAARDMYARHDDSGVGVPDWVPILGVNNMPEIRGFDAATKRRIRVALFSHPVPEDQQDETMPARLEKEADGVLALLVSYLPRADAILADVPHRFAMALDVAVAEMTPVSRFFYDCTVVADRPEHFEPNEMINKAGRPTPMSTASTSGVRTAGSSARS